MAQKREQVGLQLIDLFDGFQAKVNLHFGQQLVFFEGFGNVVVGTRLIAPETLRHHCFRRYHNHLDVFMRGIRADAAARLIAVDPRHHDIQQNEVRPKLLQSRQCFFSRTRRMELIVIAQQLFQNRDIGGIVIHN